jgi:hypothetical protein
MFLHLSPAMSTRLRVDLYHCSCAKLGTPVNTSDVVVNTC